MAAVTAAVRSLLHAPERGRALGAQARALALSHHGKDTAAAIKRECYTELLAAAGGGA